VHFPANTFPDQAKELKDNTHFTMYGAYELAKCVAKGLRQNIRALANQLKDLPNFDPAHPDPFEDFKVPASPLGVLVKPDGN
jgi:hypothetical protein